MIDYQSTINYPMFSINFFSRTRVVRKKRKKESEKDLKREIRDNNMADNAGGDEGSSSDDELGEDDAYRPLTDRDLRLDSVLLDDLHT